MDFFKTASELYSKAIQGGIDITDMDTVISWPLDKISILFAAADQTRLFFHQNKVNPCTLMNIKSGGCSEDCAFCAQSGHNDTTVEIKDLANPAEIEARYENALKHNLPLCVVSSGRKLSREEIVKVTETLSRCKGEKHASLGILDKDEFDLLRKAGVVCYNHNLETSRSFFPSIVKTHTWEDRVSTVKTAKSAGLHVCCGGIFGMGETWEQRKEFCLELKALDVDTVPLNFLNPVKGTRVSAPKEPPLDFLKIVSLFRLTMPQKAIKVCGGREYHLGSLQGLLFHAGANGYVSGGYLTTPGAGIDSDDLMIAALGLEKRKTRDS
jgi:biotin synthase